MKRNKALKVFLSCITVMGIVSAMSIPFFALDTSDKVAIELTNAMIKSMFDNGDIDVRLYLWSSIAMNINLYDMTGKTKTTVALPQNQSLYYQLDQCILYSYSDSDRLLFYTDLSYSQRAVNGTLYNLIGFQLPFNYYIENANFFITQYYSGISNDQNTHASITLRDSDDISIASYNLNGSRNIGYWSTYVPVQHWFNQYNWVPEGYSYSTGSDGIRMCYSSYSFSNISSDSLLSSITFLETANTLRAEGSGTGYTNFFCAPMAIVLNFTNTVYVDADIADTVEEYLDIITGTPTASQQARLDELRSQMSGSVQNIEDAADALSVPMPNLPGVDSLDPIVSDGISDATEYAVAPIFAINIITIIVSATLIFAVIKLLLYGSGVS